jgi:hypothetical protein
VPRRHVQVDVVATAHPLLPNLSDRDLVLRHTPSGWLVEDASGWPVYETLASIAEARLIARTLVPEGGRVWVCRPSGWALIDED